MRLLRMLSVLLCALLAFAGSVHALALTDVGGIDPLVVNPNSADNVGNSYASELAWVQSVLGPSYTFAESDVYGVTENDWEVLEGYPNYYAMELNGTPEYFFIKLGIGSPQATDIAYNHWLYQNIEAFNWAVVDVTQWGTYGVNIGRISHIGEIGDRPSVPEPATMLFLGFGLLGSAVVSRRKLLK